MKLSNSIEKVGFFWLPENPDMKFPGILNISENGQITLEISYLSDHSNHKIIGYRYNETDNDELWDIIIAGVIDQEDITLYKSRMIKEIDRIDGVSNMIFDISFALFGFEYENEEKIMLSKMKFSTEGLQEWLSVSGFNVRHDNKAKSSAVRYELPSNIPIGYYEGFDLKIAFGFNSNRNPFETKITQTGYFYLSSKELRPLGDFLNMIHKIHNFLCFAIDQIVCINHITSYSSKKSYESDGRLVPIEMFYKSFPFSLRPTNIHKYDKLFSYYDIQGRFSNIMKKWIESYNNIEAVFNLYFTSLSMFNTYSSERFLLLVRGIEVFHRKVSEIDGKKYPSQKFQNMKNCILSKFPESSEIQLLLKEILMFANQISLRQRITKMIEPFKDLYGLNTQEEIESFVGSFVNTRNYLTHYGRRSKNVATKGEDIYELCIKLEALLQLHFLKLLDMDVESIEIIARNNNHLRHKLDLD